MGDDELARLRSAHVVAVTLLGAACLFAVPSVKEERLDAAAHALDELRKLRIPRPTGAPAGSVYDVPEKPSLEWLANLAQASCGKGPPTRAFDVLRPRQTRDFARLFTDLDDFVRGLECSPKRENPEKPPAFDAVAAVDQPADDALHGTIAAALDEVHAAHCALREAEQARKDRCRRVDAATYLVSTAPKGPCKAATAGAKAKENALTAAVASARTEQARLIERSREIDGARGRSGPPRSLALRIPVPGSVHYVSVDVADARAGGTATFAPCEIQRQIEPLKRSGAWQAIHALERDAARAVLHDKKTEAQLGGELLGIQLSGTDALRWFAWPLGAATLYSAVLAFRLRSLKEGHWLRGGWGSGLSALLALGGIGVVRLAERFGRIAEPFARIELYVLAGALVVSAALALGAWIQLSARARRPPNELRTRPARKT